LLPRHRGLRRRPPPYVLDANPRRPCALRDV
jgi:hypothetical protein